MNYLIPLLILLPLVTGVAIFLVGRKGPSLIDLAIGSSGVTLLLSLFLVIQVAAGPKSTDIGMISPRVSFTADWMQIKLPISIGGHSVAWQFEFGADGVGALMVFLTGIVGFATMLMARQQIKDRLEQYLALMSISQSMLMGVFLAMDLLSFYLFFEAVLLPLILLINRWGIREQSLAASRKFLLFTLAGSIPMVLGLIGLAMQSANVDQPSTISLVKLSNLAAQSQMTAIQAPHGIDPQAALAQAAKDHWILWVLLLGFGIKLAILPLHTWLPTTYAVAHPNTTALIAAVVAKLGVFGIMRIVLPLTPLALATYAQYLFGALGAIAIVYGALVALAQKDLRRMLAYSSISHMGFITLGLMAMNREGISGAAIQMLNHGLITAAMFLMLAMMEQRFGMISMVDENRGMAALYPKLGVLLVFFTLAGAGLPGLNGFVGELLAMAGMVQVSGMLVAIAALGTVLGAWYGLRIVQRLLFGSDGTTPKWTATDLNVLEWGPLAGMAALCLYIGLRPQDSMALLEIDVARIVRASEPGSKGIHSEIDQIARGQ